MAKNGTWAEKVTVLQEESGRSQRELLALIAASCRTYINGIRCHECGERPEVGTRQQFIAISKALISNRHLHRCNACAQAAQARQMANVAAEEGRKKVQLSELLAPIEARMSPVDYGALEYTEAFFLYSALLAAGECWQGRHIMSVRVQPQNLAPTAEMATAIYMRLYDEGIIALSSCSSPRAFNVVDEAAGKFTFSPLEVAWTLALPKNDMPIEGILASLEKVLAQRDPATITQLWSMVAEAECERYFGELCTRYRFSKEAVFTNKVADSIRYSLERVSLPQVWNILWYTMREIAALIQEGKYIRPHVYNMVSGNIRRDIDRKLANNTPIRPWTRLRYEKEPIITGILFDKIFGKGDVAFETVTGRNVEAFFS